MNEMWRFVAFITLLVVLGALLPLAADIAVDAAGGGAHETR